VERVIKKRMQEVASRKDLTIEQRSMLGATFLGCKNAGRVLMRIQSTEIHSKTLLVHTLRRDWAAL
jgi:hypothetical protein